MSRFFCDLNSFWWCGWLFWCFPFQFLVTQYSESRKFYISVNLWTVILQMSLYENTKFTWHSNKKEDIQSEIHTDVIFSFPWFSFHSFFSTLYSFYMQNFNIQVIKISTLYINREYNFRYNRIEKNNTWKKP